ncbi:MAG: YbjN domain-containing protein [Bacteroidetes bacterium]|nr:YbjN domain-containing protein [Bacteroidota bacterium]
MRKHSRILAILFLIVAGGLVFYATNKDEAEIQAAVEDRVVEAITEREQELKEAYAQREQALADTLAAREQAIRERLATLDSARARVETPVYYRLSAEAIEQVLRRMGLDYESSVDDDGDPKFEFKLATYNVLIYTNGCEEEGCSNLRIYAGFDASPSLETINEWGRTKRYATAYLNENGKARLDNDLVIKGGVTLGAVEDFIVNFRDRLNEFAAHIEF